MTDEDKAMAPVLRERYERSREEHYEAVNGHPLGEYTRAGKPR